MSPTPILKRKIRRVNNELKQTVNEEKGWMRFEQFPDIKKSKTEIQIKEEPVPRMPDHQTNEGRKVKSIRSVKRLREFICSTLYFFLRILFRKEKKHDAS